MQDEGLQAMTAMSPDLSLFVRMMTEGKDGTTKEVGKKLLLGHFYSYGEIFLSSCLSFERRQC